MQIQATDHRLSFDQLPDWLSVEQARQFIGLGRATVYELIRSGELPSRKFGRQIRVPKAALAPRSQEPVAI